MYIAFFHNSYNLNKSDIDECAIRDRVLCNYAQRCLNTIGSYRCVVDVSHIRCRTGHRYDPNRVSCVGESLQNYIPGGPEITEQSIQSIFQDFA